MNYMYNITQPFPEWKPAVAITEQSIYNWNNFYKPATTSPRQPHKHDWIAALYRPYVSPV